MSQAKEAVQYGLQFDPTNTVGGVFFTIIMMVLMLLPQEMINVLRDIEPEPAEISNY
jgi:hypothetical protein